MIISASYRTDIPAFYGKWFVNRLRAGYCKAVNPYSGQVYAVDLSPEQVDGFVFWTKNVGPFLKYLPEVQARNIPFVVQHSITGYPRELEARVAPVAHVVESLKQVADVYGPVCGVAIRSCPVLVAHAVRVAQRELLERGASARGRHE